MTRTFESEPDTLQPAGPADATVTIDGEAHALRLTLGALAALEERLGDGNIANLSTRLANPSVNDLLFLLHALLHGGGAGLSLAALRAADIDLAEAARAIAQCFEQLAGPQEARLPGKSQRATEPRRLNRDTTETAPSRSTSGFGEVSS